MNPLALRPAHFFNSTEFYVIVHERVDVKKCRTLFGTENVVSLNIGAERKHGNQHSASGWRYNVVPHLWVFSNCNFSMESNELDEVEIGVFDTEGLNFSDYEDCGNENGHHEGETLKKNKLRKMSVNIHECHFSPNNCVINLDPVCARINCTKIN